MRCEDARPLLAARRELSFAQERAVQEHLAQCASCRARTQREEETLATLRAITVPDVTLAPKVRAELHARLAGRPTPHSLIRQVGRVVALAFAVLLVLGLASVLLAPALVQTGVVPAWVMGSGAAPGETLYIASYLVDAQGQPYAGTRVTALDPATGKERYRVEGADELVLSPDGARLYVAGTLPDDPSIPDAIRAVDARTGRELWRLPIARRAGYPGQQNLLVSPDGRWLYVRSYDQRQGTGDAATIPFWLQIVDTATGRLQEQRIDLPNIDRCGAPRMASPPIGTVAYLACYWGNLLAVNTVTQQIEPLLPPELAGAVLIPERERVWIVLARTWSVSDGVPDSPILHELDPRDLRLLRTLTLHPEPPLNLSPNPPLWVGVHTRLVAAQTLQEQPGTDTAIALAVFDGASGAQEGRFRYDRPLTSLAISRSGRLLYAAVAQFPQIDTEIVALTLPGGERHTSFLRPGEQVNQIVVGP